MNIQKILMLLVAVLLVGAAFWFSFSGKIDGAKANTPAPITAATSTEPQACNMDAKICPDGSSVGRTGPSCEFAACPPANATSSIITTYLGGTTTGLSVSVNPRKLVSDSRCPEGVQCIWAGAVEVRTAISTTVAHGEHVLKLGEPQVFGDFTVTLISVTPGPKAGEEIPESSYRFTFEVRKR